MLATARSSNAASALTRGRVSGTSASTRSAWLKPRERRGHHLLERHRADDQLHRARLEAAHVEQVPDQVVEPVGAVVDRLEQLTGRAGSEVDVALQAGCSPTP